MRFGGRSGCAILLSAAVAALLPRAGEALPEPKLAIEKSAVLGGRGAAKAASALIEARSVLRSGGGSAALRSSRPGLRLRGDAAEVEVRLTTLSPATARRLRDTGLLVTAEFPEDGVAVGYLDLERLDELGELAEVTAIRPMFVPRLRRGRVTSEADVAIHADEARRVFGVSGRGVKVGIVSDSFFDRIGGRTSGAGCARVLTGSSSQASGDLPAEVVVLDGGPGGGSDEGAAMAELIHDLAPGAPLLFHQAFFGGEAAFAAAVRSLRACGARVLVDDLGYLDAPFFQDGIAARAAQEAADAGVAFLSATGNDGATGTEAAFRAGADGFHDFGGTTLPRFVLPPRSAGLVTIVLQWNEPFSGTLGAGAASDLDLYVTDETASTVLAASDGPQGCSSPFGPRAGDPLELVQLRNARDVPVVARLAVRRFCGAEALRLRVLLTGEAGVVRPVDPVLDGAATIFGHPAAAGVAAIGAVDYREILSGGRFTPPVGQIDVQHFSSFGGFLRFFFDGRGAPIPGGATRFKPDLAAPDNVNTTFFAVDTDGDGRPNFAGTSAAAPHAAAVAALVREADPTLSPAQVVQILKATARDVEASGVDPLSGSGLVDAAAAVTAAISGVVAGGTTIGVFDPATGVFGLRNSNAAGVADVAFPFGPGGGKWVPLGGDWNGDGASTIGIVDRASSTFFLRNSNTAGFADLGFVYGPAGSGWIPIAGDWDGDGVRTVGLFDPASSFFFLRNRNAGGAADLVFGYGPPGRGWLPIVGDWNGDGIETIGLYDPVGSVFFLRNANAAGFADVVFPYGPPGGGVIPLAGDWNGDGVATVGLFQPSSTLFALRNSSSAGPAEIVFPFGSPTSIPLTGNWDGR